MPGDPFQPRHLRGVMAREQDVGPSGAVPASRLWVQIQGCAFCALAQKVKLQKGRVLEWNPQPHHYQRTKGPFFCHHATVML